MQQAQFPSRPSLSSSSIRRIVGEEELRPYVIVNEIGKGSFATVYMGYHEVGIFINFFTLHHNSPMVSWHTGKSPASCYQDCRHRPTLLQTL